MADLLQAMSYKANVELWHLSRTDLLLRPGVLCGANSILEYKLKLKIKN